MFFCGCRPIPVFSYILLLHNQNNKSNVDSAYCWICRVAKKRVKHIRQKWRCHEKKDISFVLSLYLHWLVRALFSTRALINPRRTSSLSRVCRSQRMSRGHNQRRRQWETSNSLNSFWLEVETGKYVFAQNKIQDDTEWNVKIIYSTYYTTVINLERCTMATNHETLDCRY